MTIFECSSFSSFSRHRVRDLSLVFIVRPLSTMYGRPSVAAPSRTLSFGLVEGRPRRAARTWIDDYTQ